LAAVTAATEGSTRWAWRLMATVLIGMAVGFLVGRLLGFGLASVEAAIVCGLTFTAGGSGRLRTAVPVALVVGAVVVAFSTLGALTTGHAVAAGLAMAFVAFTTTVMTAAKPVGLLVGMVASMSYFLVTGVGVLEEKTIGHSMGEIGVLGLVGLASGLVLVAVRAATEQAIGTAPQATPDKDRPSLVQPMVVSVRTFDATTKDAVRRAIALGLSMYAFQVLGSHNAFWVMLTVFVILQPNGRSTIGKALLRVAGTFVGVVGVVAFSLLLPTSAAIPLAAVSLAASLALSTRSTWLSAAFGAAAAAVLVGLPSNDIRGYAGARLLDTIIGSLIALAFGYLLWPRTKPSERAVPDDLAGTASTAGLANA
jgi:hypothetical protein